MNYKSAKSDLCAVLHLAACMLFLSPLCKASEAGSNLLHLGKEEMLVVESLEFCRKNSPRSALTPSLFLTEDPLP